MFSAIASLPRRTLAAQAKRALSTTSRAVSGIPEFDLTGRTIVITGGARGLGLTQAQAVLEAGGRVYAFDRNEEPGPNFGRVAALAKELGTSLEYVRVDTRDQPGLNKAVEEIVKKEGAVHGMIAAAGIHQQIPALDYDIEAHREILDINVTGVFMSAQAVARQMVKNKTKGSIVMIASMSGSITNQGMPSAGYNASKSAVVQLARNLAVEWAEHNIRVNTISPGYIRTDMVRSVLKDFPQYKIEWEKQNPMNRLSEPEEYRGAAVFLLSDASSYMTGSDLIMDGGHRAW